MPMLMTEIRPNGTRAVQGPNLQIFQDVSLGNQQKWQSLRRVRHRGHPTIWKWQIVLNTVS